MLYLCLHSLNTSELKQALQALDAQVHCILGPGPATLYRDIAAYLLDAPALRAELEGYADALTPTADCDQTNPGTYIFISTPNACIDINY